MGKNWSRFQPGAASSFLLTALGTRIEIDFPGIRIKPATSTMFEPFLEIQTPRNFWAFWVMGTIGGKLGVLVRTAGKLARRRIFEPTRSDLISI